MFSTVPIRLRLGKRERGKKNTMRKRKKRRKIKSKYKSKNYISNGESTDVETKKENKNRGGYVNSDDETDIDEDEANAKKLSFEKFFPEHKKKEKLTIKTAEVIRNKRERSKMTGYPCDCCSGFYKAVGCSDKLIEEVSRHRYREGNNPPPGTPPGFWDMEFFESDSEKS